VFYAETGKWDEFIRVLEQQEAKETNGAAKTSLLFKIAQLWADKKQKSDRASKAYEKVLELEPNNVHAAEALIPIYAAANNSKALANAIEVKLGHEQDPAGKLALLREVAALYEAKIKDPQKAFERFLSAFEIAPGDEQTSVDLERVARTTTRWEEVVTACKRAIAAADEGGDQSAGVMLRLRLGRVFVEELQKIDEALEAYRAVYDAEGDNAQAITALERLYRQTSKYNELLGIYEKKRDLSATPDEKQANCYEIAKLYENEIGDVDKAIETYVQVLDDEPRDAKALAALDVLYGRLGRWEPYVDVLRRRLELDVTEAELIDLKFRLGHTLDGHLSDAVGALQNYREILFVDAQHEGARTALESMLEGDLRAEAASTLEAIYEERGDWPKLIRSLEILSVGEENIEKRVGLKRKAARISAERVNDAKHAFDVLASALKDDPALSETRDEIEQIAEGSGTQRELVAQYAALAESLTDALLARDYWMRIASIDDRLGDVDQAAQAYYKVLALDAGDGEALAALEQLFTRTQRWRDLIGVVERRIEQTDDAKDREALYGTMAQISDEKLGRPEDAVAAYKKVLELDPASSRGLRALDDLFTRQKMWAELAENLEAQLSLAETDDAQLALMLRLADLREKEMGLVDVAIEGYRQVLERAPGDANALSALERLGTDAKNELAIADLLEPLYRASGDWQKLIGVHEVQVRRSDDVTRRVELLHQIATLYEDAAGDLPSAFTTLARALKEDPANESTQQQLDRVARATGRFADLAKAFEQLASTIEDPSLASALYMTSARVQESDLNNFEAAIALYGKVLEIDPLSLTAVESLERLFRTSDRYQDLSLVLQRKSEVLEEPADKKDALFQSAAIEEDVLNRPEAAIAVYSKVLEIDGDDLKAIDALIRRYLDLSRWQDLLAVYAKKADLVADVAEKKAIYYQVGAVFERELGDVPRSIDTYTKILELDPDDLQALSRLDVLYEQAKNWQELLSILTRESEMTADAQEAVSFQYRIAELYEKHLEDVTRAIELYREILERQPDHAPTLRALEGLKDGEADPLGAAAVLEPVYEGASDWPKLVSVHEVQVKHASDPFQKVELLHRIGRLYEDALGDHASAFDTYARALPFDDSNEQTLGNLERLAMVVNRWPRVAELYGKELDKLATEEEHRDRFVELGLRCAQILEVQLEDVAGAIAGYKRVSDADAENLTAIRSLDRLYTQTERWQDLASILVREAETGQSPDEVLEFRFRLGQVQQNRLSDVDGAIAAYREVINAAPEHQATLEALEGLFGAGVKQAEVGEILEPLYRSMSEWEKLGSVYEAQLAQTQGQEERLAAYYRLAELLEDKLVDPAKTLVVYLRSLAEYPLDEKTGEETQRLAGVVDGGWETLANAYADVLGAHTDKAVQTAIGRRLARTFEDELGDISKAEETYKYVLTVDAADTESLANLDRIYLSLESWAELAKILEMRVKATTDQLELVDLYARLGELYETKLTDMPNAIRAYRRIFDELEKTHEGAIGALIRIYEAQSSWADLDMVYQRELENASGDSAEAEIRAKIAHLAADKLGQPERAIETWKAVLDLRGEDTEALHALANLYESLEQWAKLVDILEREFDIAATDEERVAILTRRAETTSSKLGRDDAALEDWNRVLDIDYANIGALRAIADIRRRAGDPNELVASLHQLIDRAAALVESDELKEVFRELGKTYGGQLQQPYDAADAWRKLLEVGPDFEAMDALEAIYRAEEKWTDVIDVKMQRAAFLEDPGKKIAEFRSVAALWREQAADPDGARAPYEKILDVDSTHDEAFNELEKLHTTAGRWEPLVELYLGRLETRDETHEKTELLRKIARVFEEKLDDKNQALDALVNALGMDFHDRETARYIERVAQATGRWAEVIQIVSGWLKQQTEPQEKIRLCLHLAKWYGDDLGHPEYAQPYYAQIIQLDPLNVGAMRQLASLYKKGSNWQQMGATLTRALDVATNDLDRKEILTDLGELLDSQMNQTDQAVNYFQRALEVDQHFLPALENLERIFNAKNQHKELVEILQHKVQALSDAAEVQATKLRIAALFETNLGEAVRASQVYKEVVDADSANLTGLRGLTRVYGVLEQWPDLVTVLEKQLEVVSTEREKMEVLLHLAQLQEEHFLKADLAAARLEQVLEIDPNHEDAYYKLERNYRKLRQWLDLVNAYERHISATAERKTKVEIYGAIAQVFADEVQDAERAIDAYKNLVDLEDSN
ncbi:MAG: tetratricopeptide repeat protein, partial [Polyangiaceae bacterium]